jgi:hypothetical protein
MKLKDLPKERHIAVNIHLTTKLLEARDNLRASLWLNAAFILYGVIITACYVMGVK